MRMFVPEIGTRITLDADWSFTLHDERRNETVFKMMTVGQEGVISDMRLQAARRMSEAMRETALAGEEYQTYLARRAAMISAADSSVSLTVTLPAGTVLTVDRIYIRRGVSEYSSLTFNLISTTHPALNVRGRKRFWAKLEDVNRIEFSLVG